MQTEHVVKPEAVEENVWETNRRWIDLVNQQAQRHQQSRDPRLYRKSSQNKVITPIK